ncbi:MAG: histone deacetylase [Chloroflexota bacterium]|nr:histone deacetylase [Chloroflexota bacterium]
MSRTGIFFHYQEGERLKDFPSALAGLLNRSNVFLYDALYADKPKAAYELVPVSESLLKMVHSERLLKEVIRSEYYETALYSAGGTIQSADKIWAGEIDNAFVFTGTGDHHAGRNLFGGGCYLNGAALAVTNLRQMYGVKRFVIVDTDAHHGDGTWDIFRHDENLLYICFCSARDLDRENNVNVKVPPLTTDDEYIGIVSESIVSRIKEFRPELIFWNWGYDGTQGDYGDIGITSDCHIRLARIFKQVADDVCYGRLIVVLCGGSERATATYAIPRIIECLSDS